jgi:hypothetical protein
MVEIIGDFWKEAQTGKYQVIGCTTNGEVKTNGRLVMGAGIALEFADRYPWLPEMLGMRMTQKGTSTSLIKEVVPYILTFQTKHHWKQPSRYKYIVDSAIRTKMLLEEEDSKDWKILLPRPGCGLGGLSWEDVKLILSRHFDNRFHIISREGELSC